MKTTYDIRYPISKHCQLRTANCELKTGFTIIEVIISITILGLVMAAVGGLLDSGLRDWGKGEVKVEAQQNLRLAMERITRDIRLASEVTSNSDDEKIELKLPGNKIIKYYLVTQSLWGPGGLTGKVLERKEDSKQAEPVASYLKLVEFSYEPNGTYRDCEKVNVLLRTELPSGELIEINTGIALRGKFLPRR